MLCISNNRYSINIYLFSKVALSQDGSFELSQSHAGMEFLVFDCTKFGENCYLWDQHPQYTIIRFPPVVVSYIPVGSKPYHNLEVHKYMCSGFQYIAHF